MPDLHGYVDARQMIGYLGAVLDTTGVITIDTWNQAADACTIRPPDPPDTTG